jgi:hypothetical protein
MWLILYIFHAVVLHIGFYYYYQLLHNNFIYSYLFWLTIIAIIRESFSTDVHSLQFVIEW